MYYNLYSIYQPRCRRKFLNLICESILDNVHNANKQKAWSLFKAVAPWPHAILNFVRVPFLHVRMPRHFNSYTCIRIQRLSFLGCRSPPLCSICQQCRQKSLPQVQMPNSSRLPCHTMEDVMSKHEDQTEYDCVFMNICTDVMLDIKKYYRQPKAIHYHRNLWQI